MKKRKGIPYSPAIKNININGERKEPPEKGWQEDELLHEKVRNLVPSDKKRKGFINKIANKIKKLDKKINDALSVQGHKDEDGYLDYQNMEFSRKKRRQKIPASKAVQDMELFSKKKLPVPFIKANAAKLVHNLAYYSAAGAKEVTDACGSQIPLELTLDAIFLFLFSLRATSEAQSVKLWFGKRAYRKIVEAIDTLYRSFFAEAYAQTGPFSKSLMRDVERTMSVSRKSRDWVLLHAVRTLKTNPEDWFFHECLAKAFTNGERIVDVVLRAS